MDGSDATLSEELPASESLVVSPVFAWEAETAPLLPEPESLGSDVLELGVYKKGDSAAKSDSAAELAEAGEHEGECDTLGLVSSTFDGLEGWGGDDTGSGDDTGGVDDEEASESHMIGVTALSAAWAKHDQVRFCWILVV